MIRAGLVFFFSMVAVVSPLRTEAAGPGNSAPLRPVAAPGSSAAVSALRADIERLISSPHWRSAQWSITVVSLDRGDTLVSVSPDLPLAPASNLKLFTTAAALYYLGPQYRYSTFLLTDGKIEGGVLNGDLVIYGTGDPTLSDRFGQKMAAWNAFADSLYALGVREVRGNIVADASYFEASSTAEGWQPDYMNASYAATPSALSFNENVATLQIKPGAEPGYKPEVRLIPGGEGIALVNEATTVPRGRSWINVMRTAYDGPILVRGQIGKSTLGILRSVPVSDPPRYAAAVLRETLLKRNIQVSGQIAAVQTPGESPVTGRLIFAPAFSSNPPMRVLAVHESPVLLNILEVVNKKSHNLLAEQSLRTVGRVAFGEGSAEAGARAVQHLLDTEASGAGKVQMIDGSGLSDLNRVTTRSIIHLLAFMANSPMWNDYSSTLPEAGARDGLHRMYRTGAEHNLRAKTGTIDHVSALSGYVRAANGERLAFSIISNNVPSTFRAKRIEDAIGARLASFDRALEPVTPEPGTDAPEAQEGVQAPAGSTAASKPAGTTNVSAARPVEQPAATTAKSAATYLVKKGDTLDAIARRNNTTVKALLKANPGLNPRRLMPGRKINLN
jgi:D-alanyl-D-alanine carboxypeptidase/D-alanyl-D-alanine-endopeptidase (penicillin-binding protein 4)